MPLQLVSLSLSSAQTLLPVHHEAMSLFSRHHYHGVLPKLLEPTNTDCILRLWAKEILLPLSCFLGYFGQRDFWVTQLPTFEKVK